MHGRVLCCAHCLIRLMSCFLLKNPLSTWFHILHHNAVRGGEGNFNTHCCFASFCWFWGVTLNYFLVNSCHPLYQILATPLRHTLHIVCLMLCDRVFTVCRCLQAKAENSYFSVNPELDSLVSRLHFAKWTNVVYVLYVILYHSLSYDSSICQKIQNKVYTALVYVFCPESNRQ